MLVLDSEYATRISISVIDALVHHATANIGAWATQSYVAFLGQHRDFDKVSFYLVILCFINCNLRAGLDRAYRHEAFNLIEQCFVTLGMNFERNEIKRIVRECTLCQSRCSK